MVDLIWTQFSGALQQCTALPPQIQLLAWSQSEGVVTLDRLPVEN